MDPDPLHSPDHQVSARGLTRRDALRVLALASAAPFLGACEPPPVMPKPYLRSGRLLSRPAEPVETMATGITEHAIGRSSAVIYVPPAVRPGSMVGLMLFLHGADRSVNAFVELHRPMLDANKVIMVAPYAAGGGSWDAVYGPGFVDDPRIIDEALAITYRSWNVDPARIACTGFSDGATFSLSLGLANGDLWKRLVAYSPGSLIVIEALGNPPILITHGTADTVLPVQASRNIIVPGLRARGYEVDYREFAGPHAVLGSAALEVVESIGNG